MEKRVLWVVVIFLKYVILKNCNKAPRDNMKALDLRTFNGIKHLISEAHLEILFINGQF